MRKAKSSAAPLHNFCGLVQISELKKPGKDSGFQKTDVDGDSASSDTPKEDAGVAEDVAPVGSGEEAPNTAKSEDETQNP